MSSPAHPRPIANGSRGANLFVDADADTYPASCAGG